MYADTEELREGLRSSQSQRGDDSGDVTGKCVEEGEARGRMRIGFKTERPAIES